MLQAFEIIIADRNKMMCQHRMNRFREQADRQRNQGFCRKFAGMIRSLFILACVAMIVGPHFYQIYEQTVQPYFGDEDMAKAAEEATDHHLRQRSPEDIARNAKEREEREEARQRQHEEEIQNIYGTTATTNDTENDEGAEPYDPRDDL